MLTKTFAAVYRQALTIFHFFSTRPALDGVIRAASAAMTFAIKEDIYLR